MEKLLNHTEPVSHVLGWLARRCGFRHVETLRLALSAMPGTRAGSAYKYEQAFAFTKA
jgi:hypothetical protein